MGIDQTTQREDSMSFTFCNFFLRNDMNDFKGGFLQEMEKGKHTGKAANLQHIKLKPLHTLIPMRNEECGKS